MMRSRRKVGSGSRSSLSLSLSLLQRLKVAALGALLTGAPAVCAQDLVPVEQWRRYGSVPASKFYGADPVEVAVGVQGDVYVAGTVDTGVGNSSMALWRYDADGNLAPGYPVLYPAPGSGISGKFRATAMYIGKDLTNHDNAFVTGYGPGRGTAMDVVAMRVDQYGNRVWTTTYDRNRSDDIPADIVDGRNGSIYIAATSSGVGSSKDIVTLRLSIDSGDVIRAVAYDGPGKGDDTATKIFVQPCVSWTTEERELYDRVYVGGTSYVGKDHPNDPNDRGYDYAVLAYEYDLYNESATNPEDPMWVDLYHGGAYGGNDVLSDIVVNAESGAGCQGYVFATGSSERVRPDGGTDFDYATIKYDRLTGSRAWDGIVPGGAHRYNGVGDGHDHASAILFGANAAGIGTIYVTGTSYGGPVAENEIATVAIDAYDAHLEWRARFNRVDQFMDPLPGDDRGVAISGVFYDLADGIYVTGRYFNGITSDFVTIRYAANLQGGGGADGQTQEERWSITHDSGSADVPMALVAIDPFLDHKHIYVVGMSPPPPNWSGATETQQMLIKYVQRLE